MYCIVCYPNEEPCQACRGAERDVEGRPCVSCGGTSLVYDPPHVDTYSGGYGDIYFTREEAEDVLFLTRASYGIHRPRNHYEIAKLQVIPVAPGKERCAAPSDPWFEG